MGTLWARFYRLAPFLFVAALVVLACLSPSIKSQAQLFVVPLVILVFWRFELFSVRIPRSVLLFSVCGALVGAIIQSSHVALARGAFLVATVSETDLRQETKIYRDRVRRAAGARGEMLAGLYNGEVRSKKQAAQVLAKAPELGGIIWGNERWMTASLQYYPAIPASSFPATSVARQVLGRARLADLMVVVSVPSVSVSHGHEKATVYFLAELIKLWRDIPSVMATGEDRPEFEGRAYALARAQARWTSRSHLALPMWLAGTQHLIRILESPDVQVAELSCALAKLQEALAQFRSKDNPALEAAVRNNYAIALLVQANYAHKDAKKLRSKARKQIAAAARLRKMTGYVGAAAMHNRYALLTTVQNRPQRAKRATSPVLKSG